MLLFYVVEFLAKGRSALIKRSVIHGMTGHVDFTTSSRLTLAKIFSPKSTYQPPAEKSRRISISDNRARPISSIHYFTNAARAIYSAMRNDRASSSIKKEGTPRFRIFSADIYSRTPRASHIHRVHA